MSEVPKLERFNKKQVLRNDQLLFILHEKNEFFKLTEGYPPRPVSGNYDQTHIFAMKANKMNEYFHRGPIFYVCSSERNLVSSIHKGVYDIRNSLWGVATLDI